VFVDAFINHIAVAVQRSPWLHARIRSPFRRPIRFCVISQSRGKAIARARAHADSANLISQGTSRSDGRESLDMERGMNDNSCRFMRSLLVVWDSAGFKRKRLIIDERARSSATRLVQEKFYGRASLRSNRNSLMRFSVPPVAFKRNPFNILFLKGLPKLLD